LSCYVAALFDAQRSGDILELWETAEVQQFVDKVTDENKVLWLIMFESAVMEQDLAFFEKYYEIYKLSASEPNIFEVKWLYAELYNIVGLQKEKIILKKELLDNLENLNYNAYMKDMYRRKIEQL